MKVSARGCDEEEKGPHVVTLVGGCEKVRVWVTLLHLQAEHLRWKPLNLTYWR